MKNRLIVFLSFLLLFSGVVLAQESVRQEVTVVKAYEPVISDAFKISELPRIVDTLVVVPSFHYEIAPIRHNTKFEPTSIKPAKLINEPLSKIYYGYAKAGFGTYLSPMAQLMFGSNRSEKWNWNTLSSYYSTNGKVKNQADQKVYAGLSDFQSSVAASRFTKSQKMVNIGASYQNRINYYYGYNPDLVESINTPTPLLKDEIENQKIHLIKGNVGLQTTYLDSAHVNYQVKTHWQSLLSKDGVKEHELKINSGLNYFFEKEFVGVDIDIHYRATSGLEDTINGSIIRFSPWIGAFGNKWRVLVGVNTFFDQANEKYHFYRRLSMHYNIIDYFLIPYFELDGNYQENSYADIYIENNYIRQSWATAPTDTRINLTFGFRGNISSKVAFNAKVNYARIDQQYFFVNDTNTLWHNKFVTITDDLTQLRVLGEVSYKTSEKLWLSVKANYYQYELSNEAKPWHLPEYSLSLNGRYKIQEKIILEANVFGIGTRFAKTFDNNQQVVSKELPGIIDLNLGIEYRLSKRLSAFGDFNNLSSVKYEQWKQYPTQRFNLMLGVTYSFL